MDNAAKIKINKNEMLIYDFDQSGKVDFVYFENYD